MDKSEQKIQSNQLKLMILMSEKQIASIIGRGGKTIEQIRDQTAGANIHINAKSVTSSERYVSISGDYTTVIKACELICLELEKGTQYNEPVPDLKRLKKESYLKLVIPSSSCSSLIGKGGETIQDIRKTTGCTVRLSDCPLPGSSDRLATVSGSSSAIAKCLERIGFILSECPGFSKSKKQYYKPSMQDSKLAMRSQGKSFNPLVSLLALGEVISPKMSESSSDLESAKMTISEKNIGALFGKEGNKIADIRFKSGADILISKYGETSIKSREVVITGRHHSVTVAKSLINICLDQQKASEGHISQQSDPTEKDVSLSQSDIAATVTMITKHT